jgi:hypothetical protein
LKSIFGLKIFLLILLTNSVSCLTTILDLSNALLGAFLFRPGQLWGGYAAPSIIFTMMSRVYFFFHQSPVRAGYDISHVPCSMHHKFAVTEKGEANPSVR